MKPRSSIWSASSRTRISSRSRATSALVDEVEQAARAWRRGCRRRGASARTCGRCETPPKTTVVVQLQVAAVGRGSSRAIWLASSRVGVSTRHAAAAPRRAVARARREALQDRQREGGRLAGAGLGDAAEVAAGEHVGDRLRLDRRRGLHSPRRRAPSRRGRGRNGRSWTRLCLSTNAMSPCALGLGAMAPPGQRLDGTTRVIRAVWRIAIEDGGRPAFSRDCHAPRSSDSLRGVLTLRRSYAPRGPQSQCAGRKNFGSLSRPLPGGCLFVMMTMPDHDRRGPLATHAFSKSVMMTAVRFCRGPQRPNRAESRNSISPERAIGFAQSRRASPPPLWGGPDSGRRPSEEGGARRRAPGRSRPAVHQPQGQAPRDPSGPAPAAEGTRPPRR